MSPKKAKTVNIDRQPKVIRACGDTTEMALKNARDKVPNNAVVVREDVISEAEIQSIEVDAFDEETARTNAAAETKKCFGESAVIKNMTLTSRGSGGLFGFGKKASRYTAEILVREAEIELTYKRRLSEAEWNQISADIEDLDKQKDVDGLLDIFNSNEDDELRRLAIGALGKTGDERALALLLSVMESENEFSPARIQATVGLGNFRDARVITPLSKAIKDRNSITRRAAMDSLGRIHDMVDVNLVIGPLMDTLNDRNPFESFVREGAEIFFIQLDTCHRILENYANLPDSTWIKVAAQRIANLYRMHPDGFVRGEGGVPEIVIREIGAAVNKRGGKKLMLETHNVFSQMTSGIKGAVRNLEHIWDGIGEWMG
jgi:hypothetical protein